MQGIDFDEPYNPYDIFCVIRYIRAMQNSSIRVLTYIPNYYETYS